MLIVVFLIKGCPGLEHSQESVYSQKRDRTLVIQEFLDSKPQMRDFKKTRETKEQRKKPRRLSFNLLLRFCFSLATSSHNVNPSHHCLLRNLMSRSTMFVMSLHVNVRLWDLRKRCLQGGSDAEGAAIASSEKPSMVFTRSPDRRRGGRQIDDASKKKTAPIGVVVISTGTMPS